MVVRGLLYIRIQPTTTYLFDKLYNCLKISKDTIKRMGLAGQPKLIFFFLQMWAHLPERKLIFITKN